MSAPAHLKLIAPDGRLPPMVPPNVDLTELPRCQFAIEKLCFSRFAMLPPEIFKASILLYARSYREVPAGSLPNDDEEMASMAGVADVERWRVIKARVLEGWTLCTDDRFYRKDLSILIIGSWLKRLISRRKSAAANASKRKTEFDAELFDRDIGVSAAALYTLSPYEPILRGYKNLSPDISPDDGNDDEEAASSNAPSVPSTTPKRSVAKAKHSDSSYESARDPIERGNPQQESSGIGQHELCHAPDGPGADMEPPPPWPDLDDGFPRFIARFPNPVDEETAKVVYAAARETSGIGFEALLGRVDAYARHKPPKQEWMKPSTWLKNRRWKDRFPAEAEERCGLSSSAAGAGPPNPRAPEFGFVFVTHGSAQWRAWQSYGEGKRGHGFRGYPVTTSNGVRGWHFVTAWPPGADPAAIARAEALKAEMQGVP